MLEHKKERVKFYGRQNHIIEVKKTEDGQQLVSIHDFQNKLTVFSQKYPQLLSLEVEDDDVYILAEETADIGGTTKQVHKLHEIEDNFKIRILIKEGLFAEAKQIAIASKFPEDVIAEISKKYADSLYNKKQYDDALKQYVTTIGHINPSYVIKRFTEEAHLKYLIQYLEKLID